MGVADIDLADLIQGNSGTKDTVRKLTPEQRRRRRRRRRRALNKARNNPTIWDMILNPTAGLLETSPKKKKKRKKVPRKVADRRNKGNPFYELIRDNTRSPKKQKMGTAKVTKVKKKGGGHGGPKSHGRSVKGGRGGRRGGRGMNTSQRGMLYYGLGEFPGVSRKKAKLEVGRDINKMLRELAGEARGVKKGSQFDINKAKALYDRTEGDLNYIYGEAQDYARAQNERIGDIYGRNASGLESLYQGLQSQQAQNTDANRQAAMQEQARLGIQGAGLGDFDSDAGWMQSMAQANQANALANNQTAANNADVIGQLLLSMGQGALASAQGRAMNTRNDSIQDIRQQAREQLYGIRDDVRSIRKDRSGMVNDLYNQMEQNAYQRWAETQQADFNNQLAANQFNLDVSKLNSSNLWNKAKLRQEARRQAAIRRNQNRQFSMMNKQNRNIDKDLADLFSIG